MSICIFKEERRAKGVQRSVVEREMSHALYLRQLNAPAENRFMNRRIQSYGHQLQTLEQKKRGLSAYDDKRYLLEDGIHTLAFGHRCLGEIAIPETMQEEVEDLEPMPVEIPIVPETPDQRVDRYYRSFLEEHPGDDFAREYSELFRDGDGPCH